MSILNPIARRLSSIAGLAVLSGNAFADYAINLPEPASTTSADIYALHQMTATVALIIMVIVTALIIYALVKYRKSQNYEPDQEFHKGWFARWSWAIVPAIVLGIDLSIAGPATSALKKLETFPDADVTIKITGSQWKWTYEYLEDDIKIISSLNKDLTPEDEHYLRDVDHPLVLPVGKTIRFLHTSSDVLHAWWVPAIIHKKDAIPGYITETWTVIEKEGTYRGQCAENCGTGHAFMPIVVAAVGEDQYAQWVGDQKAAQAQAAAEASADKTWTMDELMARGEQTYKTFCMACHQAEGQGIPPAFPALKGSATATGDIAEHLNTVLNGRAGTAMAAWGGTLDDLQVAAVITYERNAFGNDTGDVVQPKDVKAAR